MKVIVFEVFILMLWISAIGNLKREEKEQDITSNSSIRIPRSGKKKHI